VSDGLALVVALAVLAATLGAAVAQPWYLAEAVAATVGALLLVAVGAIGPSRAGDALGDLAPTVGFLAALLLLAEGCRRNGLFEAIGAVMACSSRGSPPRLLAFVFITATAVTALVTMLWLLRRGVPGYVQNATASVFTLVYVPFLGAFVALLLSEDEGVAAIITFIVVTTASDIGGYAAGVLFGKHPMAPVISPKKSWEGFAGSAVSCIVAGYLLVVHLLDGEWWVGVVLGVIAVVMATLGDLCESVMKRDLGIKDMSQVIPGHGGLMDRLDSLLATIAPIWLLLHYLVL